VPQTRICRNGDSVSSGVLTNSPVAATPDGVHVPYAGNPQRFQCGRGAQMERRQRWARFCRQSERRPDRIGQHPAQRRIAAISVAAKMSPVVASNAERRVEASPAISARRRSAVIGESAAGPVSTGAPSSRGLNRALPTRMVQSTTRHEALRAPGLVVRGPRSEACAVDDESGREYSGDRRRGHGGHGRERRQQRQRPDREERQRRRRGRRAGVQPSGRCR